jgi:hypothetical protein
MATNQKAPTDLTGRRGIQLAREEQERKAAAAAEQAAREPAREAALDDKGVNARTGRHGGGDDLESCTERVRISFPLDETTFGRVVVDPGQFNDLGEMTRPPVLGSLKTFTFQEGREYWLEPEHAEHLRRLGYLYSFD